MENPSDHLGGPARTSLGLRCPGSQLRGSLFATAFRWTVGSTGNEVPKANGFAPQCKLKHVTAISSRKKGDVFPNV